MFFQLCYVMMLYVHILMVLHAGVCLCGGDFPNGDQECWSRIGLGLGSGWRDYCSIYRSILCLFLFLFLRLFICLYINQISLACLFLSIFCFFAYLFIVVLLFVWCFVWLFVSLFFVGFSSKY